jgi:hypothetical protein
MGWYPRYAPEEAIDDPVGHLCGFGKAILIMLSPLIFFVVAVNIGEHARPKPAPPANSSAVQ